MTHTLPLPLHLADTLITQSLAANTPKETREELAGFFLRYYHLLPLDQRQRLLGSEYERLTQLGHDTGGYQACVNTILEQEPQNLVQAARKLAVLAVDSTGKPYGEQLYSYHLYQVAEEVLDFWLHEGELTEDEVEIAMATAWLHDFPEDGYGTASDIIAALKGFGQAKAERVARYAVLLHTPPGFTRAQRHTPAYYDGIGAEFVPTLVKLCDRVVNLQEATGSASSMKKKYQREHADFLAWLNPGRYPQLQPLIDKLHTLVQD